MAQTSLTDVRTDLTYLLGEDSIISPWPEKYDRFIQKGLERIERIFDFERSRVAATFSVTSGVATLPTSIQDYGKMDVRQVVSGDENDYVYTQIGYEEKDNFIKGDYRFWLTKDTSGNMKFNTKEDNAVLDIYYSAVPTINASVSTNFPSSMVIARAAIPYIRQAEDRDADISQDEALFRNELEEVIAQLDRNREDENSVTAEDLNGRYPGDPYLGN